MTTNWLSCYISDFIRYIHHNLIFCFPLSKKKWVIEATLSCTGVLRPSESMSKNTPFPLLHNRPPSVWDRQRQTRKWFYKNTKNNRFQAGTAQRRRHKVTDGSLGKWPAWNPPLVEDKSWSLTRRVGSSSSGLGGAWQVSVLQPSWAVTAQISSSCQSSFHSRAYVKTRPVSPGLCRASSPSSSLTWLPICHI